MDFLPISPSEVRARGWDAPDFVYVVGEAYVDHPSFGHAIIGRVLENAGFRVAMLCLPEYRSAEAFKLFGQPGSLTPSSPSKPIEALFFSSIS